LFHESTKEDSLDIFVSVILKQESNHRGNIIHLLSQHQQYYFCLGDVPMTWEVNKIKDKKNRLMVLHLYPNSRPQKCDELTITFVSFEINI
jgi:hypothetical protein